MILEKKISNYCLIALVLTYVILALCGCKVHKVIEKDKSVRDSSAFVNHEQKHISNSEEIAKTKKQNEYSKITIELGDSAELPAFLPSDNNLVDVGKNVTLPKGTKIVLETGAVKEISNTDKKVFTDSSSKQESKVEVVKKEMHINKTIDKKVPMWQVYVFCGVLLIGGIVWYFRKPILSHVKGIITGI